MRPRTVLLARFGGEGGWVERCRVAGDAEVLELARAWAAADPQAPPGLGQPVVEPLFLVCTHGRKDACCAELGRPLATALTAAAPEATWETSHTGGDRFAANLLVWPAGFAYGQVPAAAARDLVAGAREGRVAPDLLRGRIGATEWANVAETHVRRRDRLLGEREVVVEAVRQSADDESAVVQLRTPAGSETLALTWSETGRPRATSCGSDEVHDPGAYSAVSAAAVRRAG